MKRNFEELNWGNVIAIMMALLIVIGVDLWVVAYVISSIF